MIVLSSAGKAERIASSSKDAMPWPSGSHGAASKRRNADGTCFVASLATMQGFSRQVPSLGRPDKDVSEQLEAFAEAHDGFSATMSSRRWCPSDQYEPALLTTIDSNDA
eukprot:scaffold4300_cov89-Phaeocystis_antarctica.AAC.2